MLLAGSLGSFEGISRGARFAKTGKLTLFTFFGSQNLAKQLLADNPMYVFANPKLPHGADVNLTADFVNRSLKLVSIRTL